MTKQGSVREPTVLDWASHPFRILPFVKVDLVFFHLAAEDHSVVFPVSPEYRKEKASVERFTKQEKSRLRLVKPRLGQKTDGKGILKSFLHFTWGDLFQIEVAVNPVKLHGRRVWG